MTSLIDAPPSSGLILPPGFSDRLASGDAHATACRLAAEGGEAASLVIGARTDLFDIAVVLAPDEPLRTARRAFFAGMSAIADAVGVFGPPEIPVRFLWPGTVTFNGARLGGGRLGWPEACAEDAEPDWLVFSVTLIASKPAGDPGLTPDSTALAEEGFPAGVREALAESFARHLTKAFEIWREDGFARLAARYLARLEIGAGSRAAIDQDGSGRFTHPNGRVEHLPLVPALLAPDWLDPTTGTVRL